MSILGGTVFILSDGTGETASTIVKAALVQYMDRDVNLVRCKNIRTDEQVESIIDEVKNRQGCVVYTVVSRTLREKIESQCLKEEVPYNDLFGPLLGMFNSYFEKENTNFKAGLLRQTDEKYFRRIAAIEFTVKHDDGKETRDLEQSDIILVGISRTSKTPLSIFLSHKGFKVSNIPLVLDIAPPPELFTVNQKKIVALTIDPSKLQGIRQNRLQKLGQDLSSDYAQLNHILKEIEYANKIFSQNRRWPVFDVTEKALEETATEITKLVATRQGIASIENF